MKTMKSLVICGPTSSGKTSLAIKIARLLPKAIILSVDSRQVYKELDIVTGKDIPENLPKSISVEGLNLYNVDEEVNLPDYVSKTKKVIQKASIENTPLIIVGGSGLYLKALTETLKDIYIKRDEILRARLEKLSVTDLKSELQRLDERKYLSLNNSDINNPRRLTRYIEIASSNNRVEEEKPENIPFEYYFVGLNKPKEQLACDIKERVLLRLKSGAVSEVRNLLLKYPGIKTSAFTSIGVSQIVQFLNHEISEQELINKWTLAEIDYARRQMVWFKKQKQIIWYDYDRQKLEKKLVNIFQDVKQKTS